MSMPALEALQVAQEALSHAETSCRYHGEDVDGWWRGEPRCDSCKQPYRVRRALDVIGKALAVGA